MATFQEIISKYKTERRTPMEKFWICHVDGTDGGRHYRHKTQASAEIEAERLACLPGNQGRVVNVLECIKRCSAKTHIHWEYPDGLWLKPHVIFRNGKAI